MSPGVDGGLKKEKPVALLRLNEDWSRVMAQYRDNHRHPINQACHTVGIPLIAGSLVVGATIVGLPLAVVLFGIGWTFQLVGHAFEGRKPSFVDDRRAHVAGFLWWLRKIGFDIVEERPRIRDDARGIDCDSPRRAAPPRAEGTSSPAGER